MNIDEVSAQKRETEAETRFLNLLLDMIIKYGPEVLAEANMERCENGDKE